MAGRQVPVPSGLAGAGWALQVARGGSRPRAVRIRAASLVERHAGVPAGGDARLTEKAQRVTRAYRRINSSIYRLVERAEREILDT